MTGARTRRPKRSRRTQAAGTRARGHDELLAAILALCAGRNLWPLVWDTARFNQRTATSKGFPDLVVIGPGGVLFRELKTAAAPNLQSDQTEWKYRLQAAGQDWAVWTARDLDSGRVDAELADLETPDEYTDAWSLAWLTGD